MCFGDVWSLDFADFYEQSSQCPSDIYGLEASNGLMTTRVRDLSPLPAWN